MNIVNCRRHNCCMRLISSHTLNQVSRNSFSRNRNQSNFCCPNCGWNLGCQQNGCGCGWNNGCGCGRNNGCGCGCNSCACPFRLENSCV
jgi:hypothetical protein